MKRFFTFSMLVLIGFCAAAQSVILTGHDVQLSQNTPNPFNSTTDVYLTTTEAGTVTVEIADINGRMVETWCTASLQYGVHQFRITLATPGTYVTTARQNGQTSSIKMICNGSGNGNSIDYIGTVETRLIASPQSSQENSYITTSATGGNGTVYFAQMEESEENDEANEKKKPVLAENNEPFRVALSLSPFSLNQFEQGYSFNVNGQTATTPEQLQQIYRELGSTEMYVRIATKRHVTPENTVDGVEDENANVHTFDQGIRLCQIAAELDIPINPEIMCAFTYMDMDKQQAPRFEEYPEIYVCKTERSGKS